MSAYHVTRWHRQEWTWGSYSFSPAGCDFCEIDLLLAEMADRRVIFAGEHTHEEHQGSVHGAYLSGKRAAQDISARLGGDKNRSLL